jgi:hypothetical protein
MSESRLSEVRRLVSGGHGDRHIAGVLKVTRWRARELINEVKRQAVASTSLAIIDPDPVTPADFAARITACWRKSAEAFIEAGRWLIRARSDLDHGAFGTMVESDLPFGARTAQRLMAIAADARLSNATHASHLPPSWTTLYELTKLDDAQFEAKIADGTINPDMERREAIRNARVVAPGRQEPDDSLDFFPTPPWATRALMEVVLPRLGPWKPESIWESACGEGHMAEVLREYAGQVHATDIFDYGYGIHGVDFFDDDLPIYQPAWIITNPPFTGQEDRALAFAKLALERARDGVALFVRTQWLVEGCDRYETLFRDRPPTLCAFFTERVPLHKGRWEPDGSTMTAYSWVVWLRDAAPRPPFWIPPGCREKLTHPDDAERFTTHPVSPAHGHSDQVIAPNVPHEDSILKQTSEPMEHA